MRNVENVLNVFYQQCTKRKNEDYSTRVKASSSNEKIKNFKFKKDRKKNNEEEVN